MPEARVEIVVDTHGLRDAAGRFAVVSRELIHGHIAPKLGELALIARQIWQDEAPGRIGRPPNPDITWSVRPARVEFRLQPIPEHVEIAYYVVEGISPVEIYPRIKRALWWPELPHPVAYVHDHFSTPNPFIDRILRRLLVVADPVFRRIGATWSSAMVLGSPWGQEVRIT